ncbi:MAG: ATP-binding protein [Oscillospiraceae bacterium]
MLKKVPIRLRLTILSVLLLSLCCLGLTMILNLSANKMADVIEAMPVTPAVEAGKDPKGAEAEKNPPTAEMMPEIGLSAITSPSEGSAAARNRFFQSSLIYMILVVVAGGGMTYYISGKALRPLGELNSQMKNRTVHNLSDTLPIPQSHDELAELTRSFNEMSAKLEEAFAMQKRFSQSAAHELRTPLTVLKTKVEVFKKKPAHTAEEYESLLSVITSHTNRLSALVKDLLDLTNMDALDCNEDLELKALGAEVAEELSGLAEARGVRLELLGGEQRTKGNRSLLHRALYNLLENAIKYNVENGSVELLVSAEENKSLITITDSGVGIPRDARELIFEPFYRVDKSRSRQMGGAGLGLATVKSIIDKHQGKITVSENPKGGTIFRLSL